MYNFLTLTELFKIKDSLLMLAKYNLCDEPLLKEIQQEIEYRAEKQIINVG